MKITISFKEEEKNAIVSAHDMFGLTEEETRNQLRETVRSKYAFGLVSYKDGEVVFDLKTAFFNEWLDVMYKTYEKVKGLFEFLMPLFSDFVSKWSKEEDYNEVGISEARIVVVMANGEEHLFRNTSDALDYAVSVLEKQDTLDGIVEVRDLKPYNPNDKVLLSAFKRLAEMDFGVKHKK